MEIKEKMSIEKINSFLSANKENISKSLDTLKNKFDCIIIEETISKEINRYIIKLENNLLNTFKEVLEYFKKHLSFSGVLSILISKIWKKTIEIKIKAKNSEVCFSECIELQNYAKESKKLFHFFEIEFLIEDEQLFCYQVKSSNKRKAKNFVGFIILQKICYSLSQYLIFVLNPFEFVIDDIEEIKKNSIFSDRGKKIKIEEKKTFKKVCQIKEKNKLNKKRIMDIKREEQEENMDELILTKKDKKPKSEKKHKLKKINQNNFVKIKIEEKKDKMIEIVEEDELEDWKEILDKKEKDFDYKNIPIYEEEIELKDLLKKRKKKEGKNNENGIGRLLEEQIKFVEENLTESTKEFYNKILSKKFNDWVLLETFLELKKKGKLNLFNENKSNLEFENNIKSFEDLFLGQMDVMIAVFSYYMKIEKKKLKLKEIEKDNKLKVEILFQNEITHRISIELEEGIDMSKIKKISFFSFLENYFEDAYRFLIFCYIVHKQKANIKKKMEIEKKQIDLAQIWLFFENLFKSKIIEYVVKKKPKDINFSHFNENFFDLENIDQIYSYLSQNNFNLKISVEKEDFFLIRVVLFQKKKSKNLDLVFKVQTCSLDNVMRIIFLKILEIFFESDFETIFRKIYFSKNPIL